jgi:PAS domain S-box-containing protein
MQLQFDCDDGVPASEVDARRCLDASRDAVVALDPNGRVVVWTAGAQRMYGWRPEEVIGRPLPWPTADGRASEHRQLHDLARQGVVMGVIEIATPRRNGSVAIVEVSTDPIRDHDGTLVGTCAIHRDISVRSTGTVSPAIGRFEIDLTADDAGPDPALAFDVLCEEYGLDALERDLVALLLTGHRIPEMARALYRSQGTVRNRLSLLYRKVGVRGQIELLDLLHDRLGPAAPIAGSEAIRAARPTARRAIADSDLGPYRRDAWSADAGAGGRATVA